MYNYSGQSITLMWGGRRCHFHFHKAKSKLLCRVCIFALTHRYMCMCILLWYTEMYVSHKSFDSFSPLQISENMNYILANTFKRNLEASWFAVPTPGPVVMANERRPSTIICNALFFFFVTQVLEISKDLPCKITRYYKEYLVSRYKLSTWVVVKIWSLQIWDRFLP